MISPKLIFEYFFGVGAFAFGQILNFSADKIMQPCTTFNPLVKFGLDTLTVLIFPLAVILIRLFIKRITKVEKNSIFPEE